MTDLDAALITAGALFGIPAVFVVVLVLGLYLADVLLDAWAVAHCSDCRRAFGRALRGAARRWEAHR